MTTWTDKTKSVTAFTNKPLAGVARWDDPEVAWDSPLFSWDAVRTAWANRLKAVSTVMTSNNPFFGWLFLFTQTETEEDVTEWNNKPKH